MTSRSKTSTSNPAKLKVETHRKGDSYTRSDWKRDLRKATKPAPRDGAK